MNNNTHLHMTIESTAQQPQQEADGAAADQPPAKIYYPGTRGLKEKKKKNKDVQSTTSLVSSATTSSNTDHFQNYDPVVTTGRKSWKHSLKRATSSVLYMAMPPSNAEQLPMVVPETPMSPDKLPSTPIVVRTPIKDPPSLAPSTSTGSSRSRNSTASTDQPHAAESSSISQMPPMPTLDLSALQRARTSGGSATPRDPAHVHVKSNRKDKERKSTSEQPTTSLMTGIGNNSRRTKSFSATTLASSSGSSSKPSKAADVIPPMPIVSPFLPRDLPVPSGQSQSSGTRSNRNSMDQKFSTTLSTSSNHQHQQPAQSSQQPRPNQDSSDDDLELSSLPLPPSYTHGRGEDHVAIVPVAMLSSMFSTSPSDEPPLPTLPLPPTGNNSITRSSSGSNGGGANGATLSRSSTSSTTHTTSTIQTTIMTATRATAVTAMEIPILPAQKPKRPKLGEPQRSSPVLIRPLVVGENEDEQAFENLLRTVIIPNNRPTSLTDPTPLPYQPLNAVTKNTDDDKQEDDGEGDGADVDNDYLVAESIAGDIEDVEEAMGESETCHADVVDVMDEEQLSSAMSDENEGFLGEDETVPESVQMEEGVAATEEQVVDLQVQERIITTTVPEPQLTDMEQASTEAMEQEIGDELAPCDRNDDSNLPHDKKEDMEETEKARDAEVTPALIQTTPREPKHKEIVIFGEDLFVEIAAPIWSGSEDEMEPKSPELSTMMMTTTIQLPQEPAVAVAPEPEVLPTAPVNVEVVSEPEAILEEPVVAPSPLTLTMLAVQKLTVQPTGTQATASIPTDLSLLDVDATLPLSATSVTMNTVVASLDHEPIPAIPESPTIQDASFQHDSSTDMAFTPPAETSAKARREASRQQRRQQQQEQRQQQRQKRAAAVTLQRQRIEARKARASPWIWQQEGIRQHRLESHQILSKEQVLERFHIEFDEEGPGGFFLFKLVRRLVNPPALARAVATRGPGAAAGVRGGSAKSPALAGKEASSSSSKSKGESSTSSSSSFAQRLKRQLWLQRSKKGKKPSSSGNSNSNNKHNDDNHSSNSTASETGEEDIRSFLMMNNNTSVSDLGSSLQELIDAVDSLEHDSPLWVDDEAAVSEQDGTLDETTSKAVYPQSDDEFAIRDKDNLVQHVMGLERRKGIYSTGRLDGMDLMPKKRFRALQRRSSSQRASTFIPSVAARGSSGISETAGDPSTRAATSTTTTPSSSTTSQSQFKKQAVMQLHMYSRNGLKFKFDVMDNDELHFVEASKKYTFMDPLPANRQPTLPSTLTKVREQQEDEETSSSLLRNLANELNNNDENSLTRSLNTQRGIHPMYMTNRQLRNSMYLNNNTNGSSSNGSAFSPGVGISSNNKRLSIASNLTSHSTATSSVPSGKRVFVTRLGRHTLLTYQEYKDLAKSPSFLTLGAKLMIQRNISSLKGSSSPHASYPSAIAAFSSPPLSASATDDAPLSPVSSHFSGTPMTPATADPGTATPSSTSTSASSSATTAETSDYFNIKKKPMTLPGFGSKSKSSSSNRSSLTAALNMAAITGNGGGGPSTPTASTTTPTTPVMLGGAGAGDKGPRAIVTPYNPNDYKTPSTVGKSIVGSGSNEEMSTISSDLAKSPASPTSGTFFAATTTTTTTTTTTNAVSSTPPIQTPLASWPPSLPLPLQMPSSASPQPIPMPTPMSPSSPTSATSPLTDTTMVQSSSTTAAAPINTNRKGHQVGHKFHHLFAMVHQRLCKLEVEGGVPLLGVGLVQWAPIVDPAELRWWRDTVGISMIGWIEGDDPLSEVEEMDGDSNDDDDDDDQYDEERGSMESWDEENQRLSEDFDDDDDEEFFDMHSRFAEDDEDYDYDEDYEDDDQRDDDEDIYDRSIGRSPPTSSSILMLQRPLSTATTATTATAATFHTARSRLRRVASPTPGSTESVSETAVSARAPRRRPSRRHSAQHQHQHQLTQRRPSGLSSSSSSDLAQPFQKRLSKSSPRSSTSTTPTTTKTKTKTSTKTMTIKTGTSAPPRQRPPQITVERLGYRFVRVTGYTGVLKVTVSEKVEARAVALAIEAQAHIQEWHHPPSVTDCRLAGCEDEGHEEEQEEEEKDGSSEKAMMMKRRPWEEGADGIGLEPGEAMVERMSMISAQARAFKGNYYMKTVKMFNKVAPTTSGKVKK
ncbi:hypothetical protein DFQ27_004935 [Actinomortierella ambigua]|uniref:Uncharacterized protein n=1 Tax=Actinomortierella ambigua TaxID=1343610 RepID=A0A9P6U3A6_9FUNG|nr:hypothetical protein DFQ27_004935 [Actinomortierella ambigua]